MRVFLTGDLGDMNDLDRLRTAADTVEAVIHAAAPAAELEPHRSGPAD
jgi:FlaA1/EpsC-like NDP-sugar epimerase